MKNQYLSIKIAILVFIKIGYCEGQNIDKTKSPTITSVSPLSGRAGTSMVITGSNFSTSIAENEVQFYGAKATIVASTATSITVVVPQQGRTGVITVKVKVPGTNKIKRTRGPVFTVDLPEGPVITDISPLHGVVGTTVTITGKNFDNIEPKGLRFNNLTVPIITSTKTSITTKIPQGATSGPVILTDITNQKATIDTVFTVEPPENFKIAFFGDSGIGPNADAVLNLVKSEGAALVVHTGDLSYGRTAIDFEDNINAILGANFPYFYSVGNHDSQYWEGSDGYQLLLEDRFRRLGIPWKGRLGVLSSFAYQGISFVSAAPDELGVDTIEAGEHIKKALAKSNSTWNIVFWHKNQNLMQIGGKVNQAGWDVYEESRKGGAIIATGHEHSYCRTYEMSNFENRTISNTNNTVYLSKDDPTTKVDEGRSFAFVSGMGGQGLRSADGELAAKPWWANVYHAGNGAQHGALFGEFNYNGDGRLARFYFKDIDGEVRDVFFVRSNN